MNEADREEVAFARMRAAKKVVHGTEYDLADVHRDVPCICSICSKVVALQEAAVEATVKQCAELAAWYRSHPTYHDSWLHFFKEGVGLDVA